MSDYDEAKEAVEGVERLESASKLVDSVISGTPGGGLEVPGLGIVSGGFQLYDGISEVQKGETGAGIDDMVMGAASQYSTVAEMTGAEGVSGPLGAIAAGAQIGKGFGEIASSEEWNSERMEGISDMISGVASGAAATENPWVKGTGIALQGGMAVGNVIAPAVFGDKDEDASVMTDDGVYHGSTGNSAVDWVFGVGKYSNGRW